MTGRENKLVLQRRFGHPGHERKKGKLWDQEHFENCLFRIFSHSHRVVLDLIRDYFPNLAQNSQDFKFFRSEKFKSNNSKKITKAELLVKIK